MKKCKICGKYKDNIEFYKNSNIRRGLSSYCKKCAIERGSQWVKGHRAESNACLNKWRKSNPNVYRAICEKWNRKNPGVAAERTRIWRQNNIERVKKTHREGIARREILDLKFKLKNRISSLIRKRLNRRLSSKNKKSTFTFLPYTIDDLIKHLESLFELWMNWQNYGNKPGCWSIDHIYPDSRFNYKSVEDEEFQKCWALENLRPLKHLDNIKKSNNIIYN